MFSYHGNKPAFSRAIAIGLVLVCSPRLCACLRQDRTNKLLVIVITC